MEYWVIKNKKADFKKIMEQCKISEVLARCLVNKGLEDSEDIEAFLNPNMDKMHDAMLMKDMEKSCSILKEKINNHQKIRIIGDYDVDGVVSTYMLYRTLRLLGAEVDYEIPDRIKDGYGININMVEAAYKDGVDTILTCDNGIVALEQASLAKKYGMTVIITDHHSLVQLEDEILLPEADAIINPKQPDCTYPFKGLCGAAIAYKLIVALLDRYECQDKEDYKIELLSYTAIATVCDVMDLVDENRIIVKYGLSLLKRTKNKGLSALMDAAGIEKEQLNVFHLGFVIGPCLNASGRLDTAKKGLELLLSENENEAVELAAGVRSLNDVRKDMTLDNVDKAIKLIENSPLKDDKVLVVYLKDCHESLAGIIAGRVKERFHKPTVVLTDAEDCIKGSARSIEQYNMIEELSKCRDLMLKVGGHPMAAGLSLFPENIEVLRKCLNDNTILTDEMLVPKVTIDIHLPFGYITEALIEELKILEPFGKGNEKPLFAEKDLKIKSAFIIGKNSSGIKFRLEDQYGCEMEALYFGDVNQFFSYISDAYGVEEADKLRTGRGSKIRLMITYFPRINEYNGFKSIQLMIQNYR
ncbi:single-stranded-DNA-specific exonuclease RecJ [Mobilitalea sibirica]|uniref:Single-stranded-DNA-specific exonuclease RecJ n=1 Tax=Mobilitalea sibirica TaxID=1462919 RepID=A0A8J7HBR4_9FIRM|nr:single-stranded-DNA-specific exonuclease RecJ [Mobilitalea sibirica]MBH1939529.1 single-stranded-DNA-specific exonuclease RecJ [Mobilitalea sibirica]